VPVLEVPEVCWAPVQAPDAVQAVALVELQVRVAEPPAVMLVGATLMLTVGSGVAGGVGVPSPPPPPQAACPSKTIAADSSIRACTRPALCPTLNVECVMSISPVILC
jgi:hypothetical protein